MIENSKIAAISFMPAVSATDYIKQPVFAHLLTECLPWPSAVDQLSQLSWH